MLDIIDKIMVFLDSALGMTGSIAVGVALLFDVLARFVKTDKAKSVIWMISGIFGGLAKIFAKIAEILDKILPQKLTSDAEKK